MTETQEQWQRRVDAFKASKHAEPREPGRLVDEERGWSEPVPRADERIVLAIYGSHWLTEVPGFGYRLVNLVVNGEALVWDLPGYDRREAEKMAVLLIDNYI